MMELEDPIPSPTGTGSPRGQLLLHLAAEGSPSASSTSSPRSPWGTWMLEDDEEGSGEGDGGHLHSIPITPHPTPARKNTYSSGGLSESSSEDIDRERALSAATTTTPGGERRRGATGDSTTLTAPSREPSSRAKPPVLPTASSTWKRAVLLNAPHILLETINARAVGVIIVATYVFFIVGMAIDLNTTYKSFYGSNNDFTLGSSLCAAPSISASNALARGCWSSSKKTWSGKVDNLSNVLLVTLGVTRQNYSRTVDLTANSTLDPFLYFNLRLYACYLTDGCEDRFQVTAQYPSSDSIWQPVLTRDGFKQSLLQTSLASPSMAPHQAIGGTIFSVFQNQESLPTNGLVKSYYAIVDFMYEQPILISPDTVFTLSVASRPPSLGYNVATIFLFVLTLLVFVSYLLIMRKRAWNEWLQEQKWLVGYLTCLIMYQNPLYIIVNFHASAGGAFAAYFFGDLAQACLLVLWLLFADSVHSQERSFRAFYAPKFVLGAAIFFANLIILSFQFPSFSPESGRSPVEAVYNWRSSDQLLFIGASMTFLLLFWAWTLVWFVTIYLSKRKLDTLSYMSTRYLQLSFRFFSLQATLVTMYYVLQYAATIYFIGITQPFRQNTTTVSDNINALFRQQTQLFGKTLFLTVYAAILAFLFLPADFMLENDLSNSLAAKFTVSELEQEILVRKRRQTIRKLDAVLMNQVVNINPHVFCVDSAIALLEVAYEAYNESAENRRHALLQRQKSMEANLLPFGYGVVEIVENKELDILCLVARHIESRRLVFAFRGTRSTKNMGNNLNYAQRDIDIAALPPPRGLAAPLTVASSLPAVPSSDELDEVDSDDSSDEGDVEAGVGARSDQRAVRGCADMSIIEAVLRCFRKVLRCATSNALTVGGELVSTAANVTPGLNQFIKTSVHSGFWRAYEAVRDDIHRIVNKELRASPAQICFTGHSLGGALATLACWDITTHSLPQINQHWRLKRLTDSKKQVKHKTIIATMYNFGSPRVGNRHFASEYNKACPDSFRVVVDGDFITSIPKTGFVHVGTEVVIDNNSAGTIIVDPSFVEQWLRSKVKNSLRVHLMLYYRNGLVAVKHAAEFLRHHIKEDADAKRASNIIRLAVATPRIRLDSGDAGGGAGAAGGGVGGGGIEMVSNPMATGRGEVPSGQQQDSAGGKKSLAGSVKINPLALRRLSASAPARRSPQTEIKTPVNNDEDNDSQHERVVKL